jgi:hypothetical protein
LTAEFQMRLLRNDSSYIELKQSNASNRYSRERSYQARRFYRRVFQVYLSNIHRWTTSNSRLKMSAISGRSSMAINVPIHYGFEIVKNRQQWRVDDEHDAIYNGKAPKGYIYLRCSCFYKTFLTLKIPTNNIFSAHIPTSLSSAPY